MGKNKKHRGLKTALAVVAVVLQMFVVEGIAAQNTQPSFQYVPDDAFQKVVREHLTELYNEFRGDESWSSLSVVSGINKYFLDRQRIESRHIQKVEQYFDSVAVVPANVLDFANSAEDLFSSSKSGCRWDEALLAVMNKVLQRADLEEVYKLRPGYFVRNLSKNREGTVAEDFEYLGTDGNLHKLSDIKAETIMLVFGVEGCEECRKFKKRIASNSVKDDIESGRLAILYITVTWDVDFWRRKVRLPQYVISGFDLHHYITDNTYDPSNTAGPFYDMSGYPVVYLLDGRTKTILRKEIRGDALLEYINYSAVVPTWNILEKD